MREALVTDNVELAHSNGREGLGARPLERSMDRILQQYVTIKRVEIPSLQVINNKLTNYAFHYCHHRRYSLPCTP